MIISFRKRFRSVSKTESSERREKTPFGSIRYASIDRNKVYFKTKIKDNYSNYNHMYRSANYEDRSIIEKKIPLSNIININNTINIRNHPINISIRRGSFDDKFFIMDNKRTSTPRPYRRISKAKYIKMVIIIQSFIRRFLSYKKYINELTNLKLGFNSKIIIYKKKLPLKKNKISFQISSKMQNFTNILNNTNKIYKKSIDKKNFFFDKLVVVNSSYDKEKISKIQKFWRKRIRNLKKKNSIYNSIFFNSTNSSKDSEENKKDINKANYTKGIRLLKARTKKINLGSFTKFYSDNNSVKRPKFIDLNGLINQVNALKLKFKDKEDDDVYNYEVIDEESFRGKSFTLFHDANQNGNYIEQINTSNKKKKKSIASNNINLSHNNNDNKIFSKFQKKNSKNKDSENIINNLKIWQKYKIDSKIYKENIFEYRHLMPNKNFICFNFVKSEKLLKLYKKKDIIKKPNVNHMKKININTKRNSLKYSNLKNLLIFKYFRIENNKEDILVLERKKIMKKPNIKNRK